MGEYHKGGGDFINQVSGGHFIREYHSGGGGTSFGSAR